MKWRPLMRGAFQLTAAVGTAVVAGLIVNKLGIKKLGVLQTVAAATAVMVVTDVMAETVGEQAGEVFDYYDKVMTGTFETVQEWQSTQQKNAV